MAVADDDPTMGTRRQFLAAAGTLAVAGCGSGSAPTTAPPTDPPTSTFDGALAFTSPAFENGGAIPPEYTGVGADRSPPLVIDRVSDDAETLALVVDDPDAPSGTFTHWLLWNVPADTAEIPEGIPQTETVDALGGARQGKNGFDELGYRGPLPPPEDGAHTYRFTMWAVDTTLDLAASTGRGAFTDALEDHRIAYHRITGTFDR